MNLFKVAVAIIVVFAFGCKCDETNSCEGLSAEGQNLMPFNLAGSTYENQMTDSSLNVFSRSSRFQEATADDCSSAGWGRCDCDDCPDRDGRVHYAIAPILSSQTIEIDLTAGTTYRGTFYPNDTTIEEVRSRNEEFYIININETTSSTAEFQVDFLGFSYYFSAEKAAGGYSLAANANQSGIELLNVFTTPTGSYSNVLKVDGAISRFEEKSKYLNELYLSESDGVVAFRSSQEGLFYLEK